MSELIDSCSFDVHPLTIEAVIQVESAGDPLAIAPVVPKHLRGKLPRLEVRRSDTDQQAIEKAKFLLNKGYLVSLGMMQINSMHYKRFNVSVEDMFDPCKNIKYGSIILKENYEIAGKTFDDPDLRMTSTLSAYYSGKFYGSKVGAKYAEKVKAAARKIASMVSSVAVIENLPEGITLANSELPFTDKAVVTRLVFPEEARVNPKEEVIGPVVRQYSGDSRDHYNGTIQGFSGDSIHLEEFCNGICGPHIDNREHYALKKVIEKDNRNKEEAFE